MRLEISAPWLGCLHGNLQTCADGIARQRLIPRCHPRVIFDRRFREAAAEPVTKSGVAWLSYTARCRSDLTRRAAGRCTGSRTRSRSGRRARFHRASTASASPRGSARAWAPCTLAAHPKVSGRSSRARVRRRYMYCFFNYSSTTLTRQRSMRRSRVPAAPVLRSHMSPRRPSRASILNRAVYSTIVCTWRRPR